MGAMLTGEWAQVNYMTYMNPAEPGARIRPNMDRADNRPGSDTLAAGSATLNPLYKEVKSRLTRGLAAGDWKAGEAIPSESRLAERFGVSIGTIRKAIDELVAERVLLRQQGRGTFVATHTEDRTLFYFFHIVGKDGSRELPIIELLAFRKARANATEQERLGIAAGAPVYRMQNLLRLSGKPVIVDDITVPAERFPDLDREAFGSRDGTVYGLYQARYGITVTRISERISAGHPPPRVAGVLGLEKNDPAVTIKRVAYTYDDTPVEYRVSWVNTRDHEYLSDLWRTESQRPA